MLEITIVLRRGRAIESGGVLAAVVAALCLAAGPATAADPTFTAKGSVEQVYVTGLEPGAKTTLLNRKGKRVQTKRAGELGGVVFRKVKPRSGYRVRSGGKKGPKSAPLQVLSTRSAPPDESIYDQELPADGYGYLTTRDGTKLAISVHPPSDITSVLPGVEIPDIPIGAPTPTLIEYSGYGYADPAGPESGISIIANLMGFTVVDVNMRGTGCSGGSFDFFEPLQSLDGYDVIETVARQPWVANDQVGMMGISYGGISQLFTAATNPPSLAAISPISLLDGVQTTLYPGGILNTGFALEWAKDRIEDARPAGPDAGQAWAWERIQQGDETCKQNQVLHTEAVDLLKKIRANRTYKPKVADPLSPVTFVDKIKVPTFMACQWTDEQTGGHCPTLASRLTGTDKKWVTFTNGTHIDSLAPETFNRWFDFLKIYVAEQPPITSAPLVQLGAPLIYQEAMGVPGVTLPPDPIQLQPTLAGARQAFEAQQPIRVLFDNGAGAAPGRPVPGYERSFPSWPPPATTARTWFVSGKKALTDKRPGKKSTRRSFGWDVGATQPTNFTGDTAAGGLWQATPDYHWDEHPRGTAVSYVTEPLAGDATVLGSGYVRLYVRSSKRNVDLQATISEVRPDGKETFVQGGWVRGSMRKLDRKRSTPLSPVLSLRKRDVKPMPRGKFVPVTIPLYYEGHPYRTGSRIRVTISAPAGDQPIWAFAGARGKGARVAISSSRKKPSKLVLPVIKDLGIPTDLPPCPALRGQPCRDYQPAN